MEPAALSQRQLDALYRLLVPRGVDPEDERTLLKMAVTMSSQLDQNRRGSTSIPQTTNLPNNSADLARAMVSKSLIRCLFANEIHANLTKSAVPRLEILTALQSNSDANDGFFMYCLNILGQTKISDKHAQELSAEELAAISSVLIAAGSVSASSLSSEVKSDWSRFMLDVLRVNLPSSDTAILCTARLVESTDCPDERFSTDFFNFFHLVFHVINHLKLAEPSWIPLLSPAVAICPDGSVVKSKATSAMSSACGSPQQQSITYLNYLFELLLGYIRSLLLPDTFDISFNVQVQLHSSMSSLIRLATNNFSVWFEYINGKPDVFQFLLEGAIADLTDLPGLFLRLLTLCGSHSFSQLKPNIIEHLLDILTYAPSQKMREDASFVIRNTGHSILLPLLSERLIRMPSAGIRAEQFALLWANMIKDMSIADNDSSAFGALKQFVQLSRDAEKALSQHPNAHVYRTIGRYLNLAEQDLPSSNQNISSGSSSNLNEKFGYYLEAEPCPMCCDKFGDFEMFKVRDVESEAKFTHCTRMIRLQEMKSIRSVHIRLEEMSTFRSIKNIRLYFNAEKIDSLASLKDKWDRWTLAKSIRLQPWTSDIVIATGTDFCAFNILIEFVDFYESMDGSLEIILCPRCRSPVTSRHGICSQCKENAFQCRQCRNINYEHLDGFLCNECGFCRFAQLQISISARPSFTVASIRNEKDRRHLLDKILCTHAVELQASLDDTVSHRSDIVSLLSSESISQGRLTRIYREARSTYRSTCSNYAIVVAARQELLRYMKRSQQALEPCTNLTMEVHELSNICYVCLRNFVNLSGQILQILSSSKVVQPVLISSNLLPDLLHQACWSESSSERDRARTILTSLCESSQNCEIQFYNALESRLRLLIDNLSECIPNQALSNYATILLNICSLDSTTHDQWAMRVQAVLRVFLIAVAKGHDNALVSQHVLVPCLSFLIRLFSRSETQTSVTVSASKLTRKHQLMSGSPSSVSARSHMNSICRKSRRGPDSSAEQKPAISIKVFVDTLLASSFSSESMTVRSFLLRYCPSWLRASTLYRFADVGWLRKLILSLASLDVRIKTAELIRILCERSQHARDALIPTLIQVIVSTHLGASSVQLFDLFDDLAHRAECKPAMSNPLLVDVFIALMTREVSFLKKGRIEASYPLLGAVSLLNHFSDSIVSVRDCLKCNVSSFVDAFLCLQGFYLCRTKQIQDAAMMLLHVIDEVFSESDADRMILIRAYIEALSRSRIDIRTSIRILEQIDAAVHPNHNNDHCQLLLRKALSQEEFIRGNMKKTPYSSADLVTMEDLKNKICRDLDLEDAAGMFELLVNGCIIDLSLPIAGVYQKLWKPALLAGSTSVVDYDSDYDDLVIDSSSMVVTYRLKGLDGEATEDIITQLNDESDQVEPQLKYAPLSVVGECGGIAQLLVQLQALKRPFGEDDLETQYAALSIRTLRYCAYIEKNRPFLNPGYHFLLSLLLTVFRSPYPNQYSSQVSNDLLDILATIVDGNVADAVDDVRKITDFLLCHSPLPSAWPRLASLLPGITRGLQSPAQVLLQSFMSHLDWQSIDANQKNIFPAECFAFVAESLTSSSPEVSYGWYKFGRLSQFDNKVNQNYDLWRQNPLYPMF